MNDMISAIRKLSGQDILIVMMAFLAVIGPGFLVIFNYHPFLIRELESFKLLVFSASLGVPVILISNFFFVVFSKDRVKKGYAALVSCFNAALSMYVGLVVIYFFRLSFGWFLGISVILSIALGIFSSKSLASQEEESAKVSKVQSGFGNGNTG